jgi:hypothetical protein
MNLPDHAVSLADCRREVLSAKRHEGVEDGRLRLDPDWFDAIVSDTRGLISRREASLVTRPEHPTNWVRPYGLGTQHSLYNQSGKTEDYSGDFNNQTQAKRFSDAQSPALERLVNSFEGHLMSARLSGFMPSSASGRTKSRLCGKERSARFHLPVITNPGASVLLDGSGSTLSRCSIFLTRLRSRS